MDKSATIVLGMIESLGDNCELGFYLRSKEQNSSSLLRWAVCPIEKLIKHIAQIESVQSFEFDNLCPYAPGMIRDCATGYSFHTAMRSTQTEKGYEFELGVSDRREIYKKEKNKHDHLLSKFHSTLFSTAKKIYVVKANNGISYKCIEQLHSAISFRKNNSFFVLLVVSTNETLTNKQTVRWINDSLCYGYIPKFAPYSKAFDIDICAWDGIINELSNSPKIESWINSYSYERSQIYSSELENWDSKAPYDVKMEQIYGIKKDGSKKNHFQNILQSLEEFDPKFAKAIGADIYPILNKNLYDVTVDKMDARYLTLIQIYANYDIDAAISLHQKAEDIYKSNSNSHIRYARLSTSLKNTRTLLTSFSDRGVITKPIRPKFNKTFNKIKMSLSTFQNDATNISTETASLIDLKLPQIRKRDFTRYSFEDDTELAEDRWISGVRSDDISNIQFYALPKAYICHEPTGIGFEENKERYYVHAMSDMYHYHRVAGVTALTEEQQAIPRAYILPRYGINNYYHSLVDRLPGLYGYKLLGLNCPIFTTYELSDTEKHFARLIGVDPTRIIFDPKGEYTIDLAYLPNIGGLRALFFDFIRTQPLNTSPKGKKIYISRSKATNRVLLNEEDIESVLSNIGFDVVKMENHTLQEQMAIASNANTIVAPHGAGLANMLFASPNSNIIELIPDRYMTPLFKQLSIDCNHKYSVVIGQVNTDTKTNQNNMNWKTNTDRILDVLKSAQ